MKRFSRSDLESHVRATSADCLALSPLPQIAFADRIVLNKLDLVNEAELAAVKEEILSINHTATLIETRRSVVDLKLILNQSAFRSQRNHNQSFVAPLFLQLSNSLL